MENIDLRGLTTRDIFIVKSLIRSLKKNSPKKEPKTIELSEFSFKKARKATKNLKGNLSDTVLDEREHYL
jgi:hypothetical protein